MECEDDEGKNVTVRGRAIALDATQKQQCEGFYELTMGRMKGTSRQ